MKYLNKIFLLLTFLMTSTLSLGCHDTGITETNAVDNGDGTYTYTFDVCMGDEDTWGFEIIFNGGTLISADNPCITELTTICATIPSTSGTGDVEYGDYDNTGVPVFHDQGSGQSCFQLSFTFDAPITSAELYGTEYGYTFGPCGNTETTTSCFTPLNISGSVTDATSGCSDDGSITTTVNNGTSPYTYSWDSGQSTSSISGLSGTYTVTVTDDYGCTGTQTFTVDSPSPDYTVEISTDNCNTSGNNGDVTWEISDGGTVIGSGSQPQNGSTQTYSVCGCLNSPTFSINVPSGNGNGNPCDGTLPSATVTDINGNVLATLTSDGDVTSLPSCTLPVESDESEVTYDGYRKSNLISWNTLSEKNNDYFTILYSNDGKNWEVIDEVQGSGNSNYEIDYYTYHRNFQMNTINYYKIFQTDYDGTKELVSLLSIDNRSEKELIKTINLLNQEVDKNYKGIVIDIYDNGDKIKRYNN